MLSKKSMPLPHVVIYQPMTHQANVSVSTFGVKGSASASFGLATRVGTTTVSQTETADTKETSDLAAQYSQYVRVSFFCAPAARSTAKERQRGFKASARQAYCVVGYSIRVMKWFFVQGHALRTEGG